MPRRAAARSVILGALGGEQMTAAEMDLFADSPISGLTLFKRNIPENYRDLFDQTQVWQALNSDTSLPLIVAIDQEGGRVRRIAEPFPNPGPALALGGSQVRTSHRVLEKIALAAKEVGAELARLGINVNLAPVVDIQAPGVDVENGIGDRAFGHDPDSVVARAGVYLRGLQAAGVHGCLKHFPGLGSSTNDTHEETAIVDLSLEALWRRELVPFVKLHEECSLIMVSHAIYPQVDDRPASLSKVWITEILRKKIGFEGLVLTDDFNMKAIRQDPNAWSAGVCDSIAAGSDLVLVCEHIDRIHLAVEAIESRASEDSVFDARLMEAAGRVQKFRRQLSRT